jgi:glycosyltransferase involved in cell wall biosynthesis
MKKYTVCFFLRKANYGENFSLEKYFYELIKNHYNSKFIFKLKICPVLSKGIFRRLYLMLWAYCNQGDINHICGDVNFLSILLKKKTILTIADNYSLIRLNGIKKILYLIFWLQIPLSKCSKIIAISQKTKNEISKYFPQFKKKISVIDVCIQKIFKKNKKKNDRVTKVLIIGTGFNKNFYNSLLALYKINCEVLIIGILDNQKKLFLNKFNIKYKNYFNLTDFEVYKVYCQSDIVLFASLYEGFGMPILEAQATGRPVITSNIQPFLHTGGKEGALYVNPHSVSSIRSAVKKIISNNKFRKKLTNYGFKNTERFKVRCILKKHYDCYEELIKN